MVNTGATPDLEKIHTQEQYESALDQNEDLNKRIVKQGELNELMNKDLILLISTSSSIGKVVFGLLNNAKSEDFQEGNCKVA